MTVLRPSPLLRLAICGTVALAVALTAFPAFAVMPGIPRELAARAAVHPVATDVAMLSWLARVPVTQSYPASFGDEMHANASLYVVEMSTAPGCLPCGDAWAKLGMLRAHYGLRVATIDAQEAMLRSGRLGLPWIGHPVIWLRPLADVKRIVPVAVGTDALANLARNIYLAGKMLTGVKPAVAVRAMAKFTGIVGAPQPRAAVQPVTRPASNAPLLRPANAIVPARRPA